MVKLVTSVICLILFLAPSPQPEDLTLEEKPEVESPEVEDLSLEDDGETDAPLILDIYTFPPGAMVYFDGKRFGISPLAGKEIERGEHYISVKMRGYYGYEKDFSTGDAETLAFLLPMIAAPEGYDASYREAQSSVSVFFDLETGSFRTWVKSEKRLAQDLAIKAEHILKLGEYFEKNSMLSDALKCRNTAAGYFVLIELTAGTEYFSGKAKDSQKVANGIRGKAERNDKALLRLTQEFINLLESEDVSERATAAHALRHTFSSMDAASLSIKALEDAWSADEDDFVLLVIEESYAQLEYEPFQ